MVAVAKDQVDSGFGRRLRELREQAGLTLMQLGERAEMAYSAIARLERGERSPTWETFVRLADALGVKLDDFREADEPEPQEPAPPAGPIPPRPVGKRK